jgi:hypothetical protein
MNLLTLDFETYYGADYTLSKLTTEAYVRDPRFQTIGVGVKIGNEPAVWLEDWQFRAWLTQVDWSRVAMLCQHTQFDAFILNHHYNTRPGFLFDTLSMARALHPETGGSLAKLAVAYGVGEKGHEVVQAKGKRREDFTPEEWLQYGAYCRNDCDLTLAIFKAMAARGFPDDELRLIDLTIRMFTEPALVLDRPLLQQALVDEKEKKRALLARIAGLENPAGRTEAELLEAVKGRLMSNDKFAALLTELGEDPPRKMSPRTGKETWAFAKSDPGMQALVEHERDEVRWIAEARIGVKSTLNETRTERFLSCGARGPKPVYLKYAGAHTFRWSGGDGDNMQNLTRGSALRKSILAPPGHVIVVADSGQIEARVVAWLAGQDNLVDAFRRNDARTEAYKTAFAARAAALGHEPSKAEAKEIDKSLAAQGIEEGDFYSDAGGVFFGKKLSKKETPTERQIAKGMLLGLGFGMGWKKFALELLKGLLGSPPVQFTLEDAEKLGVSIGRFASNPKNLERVRGMVSRIGFDDLVVHCAVAFDLVYRYRRENDKIVALWEQMNEVLAAMDEGREMVFGPNGCMRTVRHGMLLPSGLVMRYPGLKCDEDGYSYMGGRFSKERVRAYGGSMTENVVQALARIVVGEQMLWARGKGARIVLSTHDEIGAVSREEKAERALAALVAIMKTSPAWGRGSPAECRGRLRAQLW